MKTTVEFLLKIGFEHNYYRDEYTHSVYGRVFINSRTTIKNVIDQIYDLGKNAKVEEIKKVLSIQT